MGTLNAIYVRASTPAQAAAVRSAYPTASTEVGSEFYAIEQECFDPPAAALARLSADLSTDVLWLGFQSVVDAFQFHHWRSGQQLRALVYGCHREERTWELADGDPEEWERAAMFGPRALGYAVEYADEAGAAELRRIWQACEIEPGRHEPSLDAREVARAAAEYYRLPGWS